MSRTIDEKIVSMQFDNRHFERNVQTSMSTLDKLKRGLNLEGAAKGLEGINSASRKIDMSPLSNGVEAIRNKFSALEVMAVTALANITNSAVNAGKKLVSSFTVEPIKMGLQEYETQINAVQTIMANTSSKGTTLEDVNSALDTLNTYADKTIYNFTEMTRNIGTFTAAGIDLDTSVTAIQGIANLAAVSGSTSQQASTAMYQLSQALASGTVKLMDWNSVVNAGMGGQVFQDALKDTARTHGIAIDDIIEDQGSFRESLHLGWLSSDILTETLSKFTMATEGLTEAEIEKNRELLRGQGYTEAQIEEIFELGNTATNAATKVKTFTQLMDTLKEAAQSGWAQSWEIIIGDFEEAKQLWTEASDYFGNALNNMSSARNEVLQGWADAGGREMAIEAIKNAFSGLLDIIRPIKEAFTEIFPPVTAEQLLKITECIRDLTSKFKLTEEQSANLKSTFKGLFAVVDIVATFIKALAGGIVKLVGHFSGLGSGILGVTGSIGEWLVGLRDSIKETDIFGKTIDAMVSFIGTAIDKIKEFYGSIKESVTGFFELDSSASKSMELLGSFGDVLTSVKDSIKDFFSQKFDGSGMEAFLNILVSVFEIIKKVGKKIAEFAGDIGQALATAFKNGNIGEAFDLFNSGVFAAILLGIKGFVSNFSGTFGGITDLLDGVKGSLEAWQQSIKAQTLIKIAIAIGILAASLVVLSLIDPERLGSAIGAITILFGELVASMAILEKIGMGKGVVKSSGTLIALSIAVLIMASALSAIGSMDMEAIGKGLVGVAGLMVIIVGAMTFLSKNAKKVKKGAVQMVIIALAMEIFADVAKKFGAMEWGSLAKAGAAIGGILLLASGFMLLSGMASKMTKSAVALVIIGAALEIFADVVGKFGGMEYDSMAKAAVAIGGILLLASGFMLLSGMAKKMTKSAVALAIIGAALEIFADVTSKFGKMNWGSLAKAGAAIGGILLLASGFMLLSGLARKMTRSVVALTIIAAAMEIFADVAKKFGEMEWGSLAKAGAAIGGILLLASGFALLSGLAPGMIVSSAALLIMAGALAILTPVLTTLGGMSWESIAKGLVAIAGAFAILGIAGLVLGPLIPVILGLSAALALFGIACLAIGAGVMLFSAGLTALATAGVAGATAIVAALSIIIIGIIELIPAIMDAVGQVILAFCTLIGEVAPQVAEAALTLLSSVMASLAEHLPQIANSLMTLLVGLLDCLTERMPELVNSLVDFVLSLISSLSERMPEIIAVGVEFVSSIIQGIFESLGVIIQEIVVPIVGLFTDLIVGVVEAIAPYIPEICGFFEVLVQTISEAFVRITEILAPFIPNIQAIVEALAPVIQSICEAFIILVSEISPIIDSISGLIEQLGETIALVFESICEVITTCGDTIAQVLDGLCEVISTCGETIALTFESIAEIIETAFSGIAEVITSIGDSISGVLDSIAGIIESIGEAALDAGTGFENLANGVKTITDLNLIDMVASLGAVASGLGDIASHADGLEKSGEGMRQIADGTNLSSEAFTSIAAGIMLIKTHLSTIGSTASIAMAEMVGAVSSSSASFSGLSSHVSSAVISINASLSSIGTSVNLFSLGFGKITSAISSAMTAVVMVVRSTTGKVSSAMSDLVSSMVRIVTSRSVMVVQAFNVMISRSVQVIISRRGLFVDAGKRLIMALQNGIKTGLSGIPSIISASMKSCASTIKLSYTSFYSAGNHLGDGLVNGIESTKQAAYDAGYALGQAAVQGEKDGQQSESPSKATMKAGKWLGEGLVVGMKQMGTSVNKAGTRMGENAVSSVSNALNNVSTVIDSGMNTAPKIRPVVDLSKIRTDGVKLSTKIDASLTNPINTLSRIVSTAQSELDASNREVVSAVISLKEDIASLKAAINDKEFASYLDSKLVSKGLAKPINRELSNLAKRGAY